MTLAETLADVDAAQQAGTAVSRKSRTIFDLVRDQQSQFAAALPSVLTPERFTRVALTSLRTNPRLAEARTESLLGAFMVCAQLGLEPGGPLGHAYITGPFKTSRGKEVVLIVGYKGLIDLARRSGHISSIYAEAVYEGDEFAWTLGLHRDITHRPTGADRTDPNKVTHVYAVARFTDPGSEPAFVVLDRAQVESYRARSKSKNDGPWVTDWTAMAVKTAVRRLATFLPMSVEFSRAVAVDEQTVSRIPLDVDDFIDVDAEPEDVATGAQGDGASVADDAPAAGEAAATPPAGGRARTKDGAK
jgi:recombination protein RecT